MDLGVSTRTSLVSGADSGIGWHTAERLLGQSATVVNGPNYRVDAGSVATI